MRKRPISGFFVVAGTTAELLKLWPILLKLGETCPTQLILSGQHFISQDLLRLVGASGVQIRKDKRNRDISKNFLLTFAWMMKSVPRILGILIYGEWKTQGRLGVIVQGDTLSTLFGALAGKISGHCVFHVEAGYRTNNWRNPFPEEIVRRVVGFLADVHYCPTAFEANNIPRKRAKIVITSGNTGLDSLELALGSSIHLNEQREEFQKWYRRYSQDFGIMTLHRFELLAGSNFTKQSNLISEIEKIESSIGILILMGTFERAKLVEALGKIKGENIFFLNKMEYLEFVCLLKNTSFVITDSGGLAQECNALGIPCFVARAVIEESKLRGNTVLVGTDFLNLSELVNSALTYRLESLLPIDPSPTAIVIKDLMSHVIPE